MIEKMMDERLEITMNGESHVNIKLDTVTHVLSYNDLLAFKDRINNLHRVWGRACIGITKFPIDNKLLNVQQQKDLDNG